MGSPLRAAGQTSAVAAEGPPAQRERSHGQTYASHATHFAIFLPTRWQSQHRSRERKYLRSASWRVPEKAVKAEVTGLSKRPSAPQLRPTYRLRCAIVSGCRASTLAILAVPMQVGGEFPTRWLPGRIESHRSFGSRGAGSCLEGCLSERIVIGSSSSLDCSPSSGGSGGGVAAGTIRCAWA